MTQTTKPDLSSMADEATALIGRNVIIHGEYSPMKMRELILQYLLQSYFMGKADV